jgi:hypothetical protein
MKILFVADGRSPIALHWIRYFLDGDDEIHLASTYPCARDIPLASLTITPVAFGELASEQEAGERGKRAAWLRKIVPVGLRTSLREWLAPLTFPNAVQRLRALITRVRPDLIHAMRIPFEGMVAALAAPKVPMLVSVWGNDLTLHARSNPWMAYYTRMVLDRTDALHTDCYRDQRMARQWGFASRKPAIVLPGNGGVEGDVFYHTEHKLQGIGERGEGAVVVNPRGFRAYVRNDTFFRSIPLVLERLPEVRFLCPAMAGEAQAENWLHELNIAHAVQLLPLQPHSQMADLFRQAQVVVSLTTHDGTPNTLLEAMACGCFPVAGDLESLREWIIPGVNGILTTPDDPSLLADAILQALQQSDLRMRAVVHNQRLVAERAEYGRVMAQVEEFYRKVIVKLPSQHPQRKMDSK